MAWLKAEPLYVCSTYRNGKIPADPTSTSFTLFGFNSISIMLVM